MKAGTAPELRIDVHRIEPIPEADKDSTGPQQMWIWAGANIAPINWALGALGIVLTSSSNRHSPRPSTTG
jgi:nucleobase:cation symporter-1, NCS1 family